MKTLVLGFVLWLSTVAHGENVQHRRPFWAHRLVEDSYRPVRQEQNANDEQCKATFSLTMFTIVKPEDFSRCEFLVTKEISGICKLELTFNEFNFDTTLVGNEIRAIQKDPEGAEETGSPDGCSTSGGLLLIEIGETEERICGIQTGNKKELEFPPEVKEAIFKFTGSDFYNVTVRQIGCEEDQQIEPENIDLDGNDAKIGLLEFEDDENVAIKKEDYSSSSEYDYNDNGANNCNKVYNEEEFVLQSPNYPRGYPEGVMCTTVVYPANANICSLELRFDEFKVESSATVGNCPEDGDYLEIIDEDMQGLAKSQRYCGVFTGIRLLEMRKLKRFVFHSGLDGSGGDVGYSIVVKQLPCETPSPTPPPGRTTEGTTATTTVTEETTTTRSTTSTTTTTPTTTATVPTLPEFPETPTTTTPKPEPSSSCSSSVVLPTYQPPPASIGDGGGSYTPPESGYGAPSIDNSNPFLPSPGSGYGAPSIKNNNPFLQSPSTGSSRPTYCSKTYLTSNPVTLTSPNYPNEYLDNDHCRYTIQFTRTDICFLQVDFNDFALQRSFGCSEDYLEINGQKICGRQSGTVLYPISSGLASANLIFKTNNGLRGPGFSITASQVPCSPVLSNAPPSGSYGVQVQVPEPSLTTSPISVGTTSTIITTGRRPNFNQNNNNNVNDPSIDSYGAPLSPSLGAQSPPLNFVVPPLPPLQTGRPPFNPGKFNNFGGGLGFNFSRRPRPGRGRQVVGSTYGAPGSGSGSRPPFKPSYNHPSKPTYNNNRRPKNFLAPFRSLLNAKANLIRSAFRAFRLPKNFGLGAVRPPFNGGRPRPPFGKPSYNPPRPSRPSPPTSGYGVPQSPPLYYPNISPRKIETKDEPTTNDIIDETNICPLYEVEGDEDKYVLTSPNYPRDYPDNTKCTVIIPDKKANDYCQLKIKLTDFIVEESSFCHQDYVQVGANGEHMCGQNSDKEIVLDNPPYVISFKSDDSGTTRGFYMNISHVACSET